MRPDRFRAVVGLSVPFRPRGTLPPTSRMPRTADAQFYQLYFQEPGIAEAELEQNPRATIRNMLYGASGDGVLLRAPPPRMSALAWYRAAVGFCAGLARPRHCRTG